MRYVYLGEDITAERALELEESGEAHKVSAEAGVWPFEPGPGHAWREKHDPRVIRADFSRHLVERDGYPFAIGQPAEPDDPPTIAERVVVRDSRGEGEDRRAWVTAVDAGEGYLMIRLVDDQQAEC